MAYWNKNILQYTARAYQCVGSLGTTVDDELKALQVWKAFPFVVTLHFYTMNY